MVVVLTLDGVEVRVPGRVLVHDASLQVSAGQTCAIVGPSGSGKTSLLNCIAGISAPAAGEVVIAGTRLSRLSANARAQFRLRHIGLLFQFGELLPELDALENVALPSRLLGASREQAEAWARRWLTRLGVSELSTAHPTTLSGGEQQRVALARALAHAPELLLADEPTGMLDEDATRAIARTLQEIASEMSIAVVTVTHDAYVASTADTVYELAGARLNAALPSGQ